MLTQFQMTEPQAAILAACPRPRALVFAPAAPSTAKTTAVWSFPAPIAAPARRLGSVESVRPFGFAGFAGLEPSAALAGVEAEAGLGYGARGSVAAVASGRAVDGPANAPISMNGINQQDKQHLTARREPVTWRPPH
jgi:hypothetical protein